MTPHSMIRNRGAGSNLGQGGRAAALEKGTLFLAMRLVNCPSGCCGRWFITINDKECSSPAPIDAVIFLKVVSRLNLHRPGTLDGFCNNIPAGCVTVGLSVGKCKGFSDAYVGDAYTCWNSVCLLIIQELPECKNRKPGTESRFPKT